MSTVLTANKDNGLGLSAAHAQLVTQLVQSHGVDGTMSALAHMSGYETIPPSIDEFVNGADFLGPMLGSGLYSKWRAGLHEIYPNPFYSPYSEVVLSGAIGTGKSTIAVTGALYDMCKLTCLAKPQEKFKVLKSTIIIYAVINATLKLARDVLFDMLIEWIEASPYFRTLANKSSGRTKFPKGLDILAGSRFDQTMGRAIVGAILDEMNFQNRVSNQAYDNYNSIRARVESRFMGKGGVLPAHMWLVSSKSDEAGWLNTHIEKMRDQEHVRVFEYPIWEVLKEKGIYSGKMFKVFVGDKTRDPFLVDRPEQIRGIDDALVIDIPVEYKQDFVNDILRSLQDLAGCGTWSAFNFIPSGELIGEMQVRENPLTREVITLDFFDKEQKLIDYIQYHTIALDSRPRFIHTDIGLKHDKTGIAATRFGGMVTLKRTDPLTGVLQETKEPIFFLDWVMAIEPRPGHEVALYKIKNLMTDLRKRGYPIAAISTDGFQSANLRQDLLLLGFETELISVDKKRDPYDYFKNTILESRINGVRHSILDRELRRLVDLEKKIDHPVGEHESKDLCLSGNTQIRLLNGEVLSIEQLYDEERKNFYVFSSTKGGEIVPGLVHYVKKFCNEDKQLISLTLDNGFEFKVTPDHLIMLRNGSYRKASELLIGDSLMPLYLEEKNLWGDSSYYVVKCNKTGRQKRIHSLVAQSVLGLEIEEAKIRCELDGSKYTVIHHSNHNKLNNDPSNLIPLTIREHRKLHGDIFVKYNKSLKKRENLSELAKSGKIGFLSFDPEKMKLICSENGTRNITIYNKSDKHRKVASEIGKKTIVIAQQYSNTVEAKQKMVVTRKQKRKENKEYRERLDKSTGDTFRQYNFYKRYLKEKSLQKDDFSFSEYKTQYNHKVVRIDSISSNKPVYDFVMSEYHNFAINAGVFVHNCDAVCGSVWLAYTKQDQYANIMPPQEYMDAMDRHLLEEEGGLYGQYLHQSKAHFEVYK